MSALGIFSSETIRSSSMLRVGLIPGRVDRKAYLCSQCRQVVSRRDQIIDSRWQVAEGGGKGGRRFSPISLRGEFQEMHVSKRRNRNSVSVPKRNNRNIHANNCANFLEQLNFRLRYEIKMQQRHAPSTWKRCFVINCDIY